MRKQSKLDVAALCFALAVALIIIAFTCNSCQAQALKVQFEAPDNADPDSVDYYIVYVFEGDSAAWQNWTIADMDSFDRITHVYGDPLRKYYSNYTFQEDAIIRAGSVAIDKLTRRSPGMALSDFHFWPNIPKFIAIVRQQ